jgi:hypothetical protein
VGVIAALDLDVNVLHAKAVQARITALNAL